MLRCSSTGEGATRCCCAAISPLSVMRSTVISFRHNWFLTTRLPGKLFRRPESQTLSFLRIMCSHFHHLRGTYPGHQSQCHILQEVGLGFDQLRGLVGGQCDREISATRDGHFHLVLTWQRSPSNHHIPLRLSPPTFSSLVSRTRLSDRWHVAKI
ncbi:hypothetical protein BDW22DRAFT_919743 [Trametopsis cervina]|nr:hypothetical protein BDW22DRAFT_919743 [Trametopsis cervina]